MDERMAGRGVCFERIRRITGYLAGDVRHFSDAEKAEVCDRIKHTQTKPKTEKVTI